MTCISEERLARLALEPAEDADAVSHLQQCAACRTHFDAMRLLTHQLAEIHAKLGERHEEARERLLAILPAAIRPPEPARPWNLIFRWIGGLSMRQRMTALGGVGVAASLAFLLLLGAIDTKRLSAMEQMAENVQKAKSWKYNLTVRITRDSPASGKPSVSEYSHIIYGLASGSSRIESIDSSEWKGSGPEVVEVNPAGKPGIVANYREKTFRRLAARQAGRLSGSLDDFENLCTFSGRADRELGVKEINGKKARGFQVDMKKVNGESGMAEIWLDPESNLPLLVRYELKMPGRTINDVISDIQWNIDLDPKLFETTPPKGYSEGAP
jgi:hypothetical protein